MSHTIEITNMQKVRFKKGETVAFFDLHLENIKIKNCNFAKCKSNNCYYWSVPRQKFISKITGKTIFSDLIEIEDENIRTDVFKLVTKAYGKIA